MRLFAFLFIIITILISAIAVPTATANSPTQQESCVFIVTVDVTRGFSQPVTDPAFEIASVQGGLSYPVLRRAQQHFYVQYTISGDGLWLDRRSGYVEGNCLDIPVDERPLTDYEELCFFTPADHTPFFTDSQLTQQMVDLSSDREILVTGQTENAYFLYLDHAMGGWVAVNSGTVRGDCGNLSHHDDWTGLRGTALDNARLWSEPNVQTGTILADITAGTALIIEDGPRMGPIRTDTDDRGHFYLVRVEGQTTSGWIWSARLLPSDGDPTNGGRAMALENARLWSEPDVTLGTVTSDLAVGTVVTIQGQPQLGRIRTDTDDMGYWYLVTVEGTSTTGWIWSERLTANTTAPINGTQATALENARLWTQPDVRTGTVITDLSVGTVVTVEAGPELGRIRTDTDDLGHWYYVRIDGTNTAGWIWSPRLNFVS